MFIWTWQQDIAKGIGMEGVVFAKAVFLKQLEQFRLERKTFKTQVLSKGVTLNDN